MPLLALDCQMSDCIEFLDPRVLVGTPLSTNDQTPDKCVCEISGEWELCLIYLALKAVCQPRKKAGKFSLARESFPPSGC